MAEKQGSLLLLHEAAIEMAPRFIVMLIPATLMVASVRSKNTPHPSLPPLT